MKSRSDIGASVRSRLLRLAHERGEDFQLVLVRYANERLLYRIARSRYASNFVLKGAALFTIWIGEPHRATRDIDLLGSGEPREDAIRSIFAEILGVEVEDDGVAFDLNSLTVSPIREQQEYGGIRVLLRAEVKQAQVRLQIDVGFGDAITPEPQDVEFPPLLDLPAPKLRAYPPETVIAEKLEAMVKLGEANSRMKDFFDLLFLSEQFSFKGTLLVRAISATFARRGTGLPTGLPVALTPTFTADEMKNSQWRAFLRKSGSSGQENLRDVATGIARFVEEPLAAAKDQSRFTKVWTPGGPWADGP